MSITVQATDVADWQAFLNDKQVQVSGFGLRTLQGSSQPTSVSCTNDRFWGLQFDSANNKTADRFGKEVVAVDHGAIMSLASDTITAFQPVTIGKILTSVGVLDGQIRSEGLVSSLFDILTKSVTFKLDSSEPRNAMWITPGQSICVDTALTLDPQVNSDADSDGLGHSIGSSIMKELQIQGLPSIPLPSIVIQRTVRGMKILKPSAVGTSLVSEWYVTSTYQLSFKLQVGSFVLWVTMEPTGVSFSLTRDSSQDSTVSAEGFWSNMDSMQIGKTGGEAGLASKDIKPIADFLSGQVELLELHISKNSPGRFSYGATATVNLKKADDNKSGVDIYLTYDSTSQTFTGGIVLDGFYSTDDDRALVGFDPTRALIPREPKTYGKTWDLRQYFSDPSSVPQGIPTAVSLATISMTFGDTKGLACSARIVSPPQQSTGSLPSPFVWKQLDVFFSKSSSSFSCSLSTYFQLQPPKGKSVPPADMSLSFQYDKRGWALLGHVENLSGALLFSFFDKDDHSAIVDILGRLNIQDLSLLWTHTAQGAAASFLFTGTITFGELTLRLFYQYASSVAGSNAVIEEALKSQGGPKVQKASGQTEAGTPVTTWMFECDLETSTGKATIGSIADSIIEDASNTLPAFVANIKVPSADGTTNRRLVTIQATKDQEGRVLFAFELTINMFSLTFVQVAKANAGTKRLIRFTVDKLPTKERIPLLDTLPQPFDQLIYMWVSETGGGFSKSDVDALSVSGLLSTDALMYKPFGRAGTTNKDSSPRPDGQITDKPLPSSDPIVLTKGHHFMVIQNGKVAVDHNFLATPVNPPANARLMALSSSPTLDSPQALAVAINAGSTVAPSQPSKGDLSFKLGPLAIDAITLQFKEKAGKKNLQVTMDATFTIGPITFSLLGFGFSVSLEGFTLDSLKDAILDADVVLAGLAFSFNKPPLLIAGGFEHAFIQTLDGSGKSVTEEIYMGGVGISFPPYTFVGLGEYAIVKSGGNTYKSTFLFAKLDGPLITLEFATISGVRLGLGINSVVRSPAIEELTSFPFINDGSINGHGNDPMAILKAMTVATGGKAAWVTPKLDSYWFAAGMSITAFDILKVTAVAMLSFRDSGLIVSLYADAIAQMPPDSPPEAVIVYVELGMVAELNFIDGYFRVEAALAPTSYLLVPQCHLYGGFALVYWFPPSDHAGDWVFTVGGYHRSYSPPSWYPVPRRLGISFQVDIISIVGESYFAITPKCAMGGAMLHASLSFGPISAWLDATFDALLNFHPLHYAVDFSVDIGVVFDADILFIHVHISAHVGARLHIEGPEFGGVAHVDFYLFGFDVDFGASPSPPPALDLFEFWNTLHKPGPTNPDTTSDHDAPLQSLLTYNLGSRRDASHPPSPHLVSGAAHKYILEDGNFNMPKTPEKDSTKSAQSTGAGAEWYVKGGSFKFRISCDFALSSATIDLSQATMDKNRAKAKAEGKDGTNLSSSRSIGPSNASIYCKPMHMTDKQYQSDKTTSVLSINVKESNTGRIIDSWRSAELVYKDVPTALWNVYDASKDPRHRPDELLHGENSTIKQAMSIALTAPPPVLSPPFDLPGFIPKFKATAAAKFGILDFRTAAEKNTTRPPNASSPAADTVNGTLWFIPPSELKQSLYLPRVLSDSEKKQDNNTRWTTTRQYWSGLKAEKDDLVNGKSGTAGLLTAAATLLGWDTQRPPNESVNSETSRKPWQLSGGVPLKLVKNLEALYLELPRIAVAATA